MAEVFRGTPAIVTVTVSDQEGKQVNYHVAGRDFDVVKDYVFKALEAIPDQDETPVKQKRHRRTKSEMVTTAETPEAWPK